MTTNAFTVDQRRLLALCAIQVGNVSVDWNLIARQAQHPDGLDRHVGRQLRRGQPGSESVA